MDNISVDISNTFIQEEELFEIKDSVNQCVSLLENKVGEGSDCLGWIELPKVYDKEEFDRIKNVAEDIKTKCDVFVIIGIGGSYLGARAAISALSHSFYNDLDKDKRKTPKIYFAGNNISGKYMSDLMDVIKEKELCLNVISKSGTTIEPALTFRILKEHMEKKYGKKESAKRIIVTTDKSKGALKMLANKEGYEQFIIPDDIGGRYSVLTAVGLLPIAVAGLDIDEMMRGAYDGYKEYKLAKFEENMCQRYATIRNILYNKGKNTEVYVSYEPYMHYLGEWLRQLYGESEGKDGKGILPVTLNYSTDLHSMGQYIQDGRKNIFETVLNIHNLDVDMQIMSNQDDLDGLNYLAGKTMNYVNDAAYKGTLLAHVKGNVPNIIINIPTMNEYYLGKLFYMFEKSCGISGYLLGINPFNQPGVENYKKNMFMFLGRESATLE